MSHPANPSNFDLYIDSSGILNCFTPCLDAKDGKLRPMWLDRYIVDTFTYDSLRDWYVSPSGLYLLLAADYRKVSSLLVGNSSNINPAQSYGMGGGSMPPNFPSASTPTASEKQVSYNNQQVLESLVDDWINQSHKHDAKSDFIEKVLFKKYNIALKG